MPCKTAFSTSSCSGCSCWGNTASKKALHMVEQGQGQDGLLADQAAQSGQGVEEQVRLDLGLQHLQFRLLAGPLGVDTAQRRLASDRLRQRQIEQQADKAQMQEGAGQRVARPVPYVWQQRAQTHLYLPIQAGAGQ